MHEWLLGELVRWPKILITMLYLSLYPFFLTLAWEMDFGRHFQHTWNILSISLTVECTIHWMYYSLKIVFNWFCECFLSKAPVLYSICQDITNKFGFAINFEWIFLEAHEKIQSIFAKWIYFLVCRMNLMGTYDAIANVSSRITAYIPWSSYKLNYVTFDITSTNDRSIYWQYDLLHLLSLFDELK